MKLNHRPAFTLIEVVLGLTLMGTVLVGSILAFSRHRRQLAIAESRVEATQLADRLLTRLSAMPDGVPLRSQGRIPGYPGLFWKTSVVRLASPFETPIRIIRLEIRDAASRQVSPLVSVEIAKPIANLDLDP